MNNTPNTIQINVEIGEGYSPTPRIAAALTELHDALVEAGGGSTSEVEGFGYELKDVMVSSMSIKADSPWKAPQPMGFSWGATNGTNTTNYSLGGTQAGSF
jgi:hypothetical protein